jgi:hypothetical protein
LDQGQRTLARPGLLAGRVAQDARIKRDAARQEVRAGVDIVQAKRSAREDARAEVAVAAASTFKERAERYIKDNEAKWSKKHAAQWPSSLKQHAYPTIGHLRIAEILPSHIFERLAIWKIPGERMKMDEDHSVPLSDPALAILDKMRDGSQSELIFPSVGDEPFSNMAMLAVLDRLGYGHVTVHGFRATFATWAEECTDYPDGVREAALSHKYKNETVAAYQCGAKLEKRRALMSDWANFCAAADKVVALRSA